MKNYKLSPFNNPYKDLLFWIKHYINQKFINMEKKDIRPDFDMAKISSMLIAEDVDTIEKLGDVIKDARKFGLTGITQSYSVSRDFYKYCKSEKLESIKDVTNATIRDFTTKKCNKLSPSTKKNYYYFLMGLFDYIDDNNIDENKKPYFFKISFDRSGKKIKAPFLKTHKRVVNYLTQEQLSALSKSVVINEKKDDDETAESKFNIAKNILIVRLLIYTGMTVSELVSLKDDDWIFDTDNANEIYIKIDGKGAKKRELTIPRGKFIEYHNTYVKYKQKSKQGYFFYAPSEPNKKMNTQKISYLLNKHFKLAKISVVGGATSVRNGLAVYLYRKNYALIKIKTIMGHSDIRTTRDLVSINAPKTIKTADIFDALSLL